MTNSRPRSAYEQGKRLMIASFLSLLLIVWGIPIATSAVGLWHPIVFSAILPLGIAWFLYFGIKSFKIACPICRRSVFIRGYGWSAPWPARRCSKCGRDSTIA
jgi:hypothetical protein